MHNDGFAKWQGLDHRIGREPGSEHPLAVPGSKVGARPPASVITMGMGDQRPVDRLPGVDGEVTRRTIEPAIRDPQQVVRHA